jgi:hypothetical protein
MPNNKWTKTATSASLAILGVTQLNNKADANIVQGGSNFSRSGLGASPWALDAVPGYGAVAQAVIFASEFASGLAYVASFSVFVKSNQVLRSSLWVGHSW